MTITRYQVESLNPGDVVEITCDNWPAGTTLTGPLRLLNGNLVVGNMVVRWAAGFPSLDSARNLTVVAVAR